jgi:hypothetical protein
MLASFATAPDNLYMAPRLAHSFAPAAMWNLLLLGDGARKLAGGV